MEAILRRRPEQEERFNPFPGLRPFNADEDHLFFGRERETDELLRRLRANRFVSVLGTSGSGKSSLVRSGLIPSLYSGFMVKAGSTWRVAVFRPGDDPIGGLASALDAPGVLGDAGSEMAGANRILLETTLRRSTVGLADCVHHAHLPPHENVLVVVDQFEELFRFKESRKGRDTRDEAVAFCKLLLEAAGQQKLPIYIVLTMRSDFIGDCMEYPGLPEAINQGQYLIPRMTREELRSAVSGPVAVGGGEIAPRLVARLLNDVGDDPDQLPVLQHALMRTWDRWIADQTDGEPMDLRHYESIGTMASAMSLHADEAFDQLEDHGRFIAERLFKALTDTRRDNRGVRRPTPVSEVAAVAGAGEAEVIEVVDAFRRPGRSFLMPPPGVELTGDSILDLSHESLMRCWRRLATWVEEETASGKSYRHLSRAARRHRGGQGSLWAEPELSIGLRWREENRPTQEWARRYDPDFDQAMGFLDESQAAHDRKVEEEERERRAKLRHARVLAGVLGSAAAVTLVFGAYALYAGSVARRAEQRALKEAETARAVSGFLVDLFQVVDPEEAQGNKVTAREILDEGARNIETRLAEQPEVRSRLMASMGRVYGSLGLFEQAQPLLERAVETARASLGDEAPDTLEASDRLARLYFDRGRFKESQEIYARVVDARRRIQGNEHPDTLRSMAGLADLSREQGQHGEAEKTIREALEAQRRVLGDEHEDTLRSMNILGRTLGAEGKYREAEPILVKTLETRKRTLGDEHPDTLSSLEALGTLYIELGRYDEAGKLYQANLESRRKVFGDEHPKTFTARQRLVDLDVERGQYKSAEALERQVLEGRRRVLGEVHPATLESQGLLGWIYGQEGRWDEAQPLVDDAHEKARRVLGEEHPKTRDLANTRAVTYQSNGRFDLAEAIQTRNVEIYRKLYGDVHPDTMTFKNNLANIYQNWGQAEKAEQIYKQNFETARDAFGDENPLTIIFTTQLVWTYNQAGRRKEAEELGLKIVETARRVLGPDHPATFTAMSNLAAVYRGLNRLDDTERLYRELLEGRRRAFGEDHPQTLGSKNMLAGLFQQRGRYEEAEALILDIQESSRRIYGEEHPRTIGTYGWLSWLYPQMGKPERALPLQKKVLSILKQVAERADANAKDRIDYARQLVDAPEELQNPKEAIQFAREANEMSGWKNRNYVATLAEAYSRAGDQVQAVETIKRALALVPEDNPRARNQLESRMAAFLEAGGDTTAKRKIESERLARLRDLASAADASPNSRNSYAWSLLTANPAELRDPAAALRIALEVNDATGFDQPNLVNTLAVAYFLNGQKAKAIETEKKALAKIPPDDQWQYSGYQDRVRAFESTRTEGIDLEKTLEGTWSGKAGPLDVRVEFHRDGGYVVATNRLKLPWLPADKVMGRFNLETSRLELQRADTGWTNLRWEPGDYAFTPVGELLVWAPTDWSVFRLAREKPQAR